LEVTAVVQCPDPIFLSNVVVSSSVNPSLSVGKWRGLRRQFSICFPEIEYTDDAFLHKVFKLKDLHVTQQELETRGFAVADGQSDAVLSV